MAMTGVLRPGHLQLRVLDIEKSRKFYRDIIGLVETGMDAQGRVYFKAWDERDHNSIILRQADRAGVDFIGFRVLNKLALDRLEQAVQEHGISTERIPAGDLLETGERVRFELPSGHPFEFYAEKTHIGNGLGMLNPRPWGAAADYGIAPTHFDHCLLYGPNLDATRKLFTEVLGFFLVERVLAPNEPIGGKDVAIWLSCSIKTHDIAFVEHAEPGKLHHVSFRMPSGERIQRAADILGMNKVPVDIGPTRHGITRGQTIYAWDPSGNRFETFTGDYEAYPDYEPITWTFDELGYGLDYSLGKLHETFLTVMT
ncbi:MAG: catechol 2,3-dioxygenase [Rhodanobacter sp.]|jgi:catechol 2,3-dioxygenase|nr:catechol 2,3-dioxygenase [Rhodanobacter sp.]